MNIFFLQLSYFTFVLSVFCAAQCSEKFEYELEANEIYINKMALHTVSTSRRFTATL